ncbi:transposable element Tcb2 transposase [Trichonephila clavipes]|uniref:Transposable element Tcb2 transposase n=1 Tax=Trichonephila clavipes TaxID=2585209 RepID=A0A8X6S4S4_TRICX|nr:transposable element Tcb2 transposase [Trichonephila clavipes]
MEENLRKRADLVSELRSSPRVPLSIAPAILKSLSNILSPFNEESSTSKANNDIINPTDSTNNPKNTKTKAKGKNIKTKNQKDSSEDFVSLPQKPPGLSLLRVEGFLVRGVTQCYNCNNFYHTADNCHLKPRCLKCGSDHPTKQFTIKEKQDTPYCINCQEYGHTACFTKCPKFSKPKKGSPLPLNKTFKSNARREGVSFANIVSGDTSPSPTPIENQFEKPSKSDNNNKEFQGIQSTGSTCVFSNHTKAPGSRTCRITAPITCAALDAHPSTPNLDWCHARGNWTAVEWNHVDLSDKFNLSSDGNRVRVWRHRGEQINPAFALQRHTASTAGVKVWSAIAYNTRSSLVLIRDSMTAQRYVDDSLQPHVLQLM